MGTHAHMMRQPSSSFFGVVETEHGPEASGRALNVARAGGWRWARVGPAAEDQGWTRSAGNPQCGALWGPPRAGTPGNRMSRRGCLLEQEMGTPGSAWASIARDLGHPELRARNTSWRVLRVQLFSLLVHHMMTGQVPR
jgi:hypothetical protein